MKPTTLEWMNKAEADWHVAQMSYRARKHPSYNAAVFPVLFFVLMIVARLMRRPISQYDVAGTRFLPTAPYRAGAFMKPVMQTPRLPQGAESPVRGDAV